MKSIYSLFVLILVATCVLGKDIKPKSTTSSSKDNDDPGKIRAYCLKYGTIETLYIKIVGAECPGYVFDSITVTNPSPNFHLLGVGEAVDTTVLDSLITPTATNAYLLPVYCQVDAVVGLQPQELVLLTVNMVPTANAAIECSRSKISLYVYLSENGCAGSDTTFSTGKCYQCKANTANQFPVPSYVHFTWTVSGTTVSFVNQSVFNVGDTLVLFDGNGDSTEIIPTTNALNQYLGSFTYPSFGTVRPSLKIKCSQNKGTCIYRAYASILLDNPLDGDVPQLFLTSNLGENKHSIALNWSMLGQNGTVLYEIERSSFSPSLNRWQKIGRVSSHSFVDTDIQYGSEYYYRIVTLDKDGKTKIYSNLGYVNVRGEIVVSPNPVRDRLNIRIDLADKESHVFLYSSTGNLIYEFESVPESMDMEALPSGVYYLRIGRESIEVVKL